MNKRLHTYFRFVALLALLSTGFTSSAQTYTFTKAVASGINVLSQQNVANTYTSKSLAGTPISTPGIHSSRYL